MKTITLGGREITLVGSPLTPYFYKKAFGQSFSGDFLAMQEVELDQSKFDDVNLLQMVWAMEYTAKMGKGMKDFESWLADFEYLDLSHTMTEIAEEAMSATFRSPKASDREQQ